MLQELNRTEIQENTHKDEKKISSINRVKYFWFGFDKGVLDKTRLSHVFETQLRL